MILINVSFHVRPECSETFLDDISWFTEATRAEDGNLFFDWYCDPDDDNHFLLVEGFTEEGAGPHVNSEHFERATKEMPTYLVETPRIINTTVEGQDSWGEMAEFKVEG